MRQHRWFSACAGLAVLLLATGSVAHAEQQDGQNQQGNSQGENDQKYKNPVPAATPEMDTSVLYAIGLTGALGTLLYAQRRRRGASESE
jgi:hypothetical protein